MRVDAVFAMIYAMDKTSEAACTSSFLCCISEDSPTSCLVTLSGGIASILAHTLLVPPMWKNFLITLIEFGKKGKGKFKLRLQIVFVGTLKSIIITNIIPHS